MLMLKQLISALNQNLENGQTKHNCENNKASELLVQEKVDVAVNVCEFLLYYFWHIILFLLGLQ